MRNDVDRDAFQLGKRACRAGMEPRPGIFTLGEDGTAGLYDAGVITGFGHNDKVETSKGYLLSWGGELVPDLRDPGTKGHAIAQLRERTGDPHLVMLAQIGACGPVPHAIGYDPTEVTEEEAIVIALEMQE